MSLSSRTTKVGSPPRMRGKHFCGAAYRQSPRITPADAGKTRRRWESAGTRRDHPRRCGENRSRVVRHSCIKGSPPQVRGKHNYPQKQKQPDRITPAGAGKTTMSYDTPPGEGDHPRRCGENGIQSYKLKDWKGSPPQVRGKPILVA